jgi:hypothetical protein
MGCLLLSFIVIAYTSVFPLTHKFITRSRENIAHDQNIHENHSLALSTLVDCLLAEDIQHNRTHPKFYSILARFFNSFYK